MQPSGPVTAGDTARVAVIGCGAWGRNLVRAHASLGSLVAVVDADPGMAAAQAELYGVAARTVEEVLADPEIDAVVIAAPAIAHAELARRVVAAGKHVFVEKPLALTVPDAEAVVAEAEAAGVVLMVGHLLQYHPAFLALRDLVAEGRLGELRYLYSNRLNLGRIRQEENSLWSFAPHDLSMLLALVGEEPDEVTATGGYFLHPDIADVTTTHLSFPSGPQAHVFVSWLHPFKEQRLVVVGSDAMAVFDDTQDWAEKLVGTYKLLSFENFADDGEVQTPFGTDPRGFAMYTAEGYMSAILMVRNRPNFPEGDILAATDTQRADAWELFSEASLMPKASLEQKREALTQGIALMNRVPRAQVTPWLTTLFSSDTLGPIALEIMALKAISIGSMLVPGQAVVWRGPMLHRQLTLFLQHTDWGELDYLFIDMPPGTGDVALSLSQMVQAAGAVVVCTPQQLALLDAVRAISMFRTVKIPVLGMVENMSGEIFGRGGTRAKAAELGVPFLGEVPIDASVRVQGDAGHIADLFAESSPVREPLLRICERTAIEVAKQILEAPAMPTLEML